MNKGLKIAIAISLVGGAGAGIYFLGKSKKWWGVKEVEKTPEELAEIERLKALENSTNTPNTPKQAYVPSKVTSVPVEAKPSKSKPKVISIKDSFNNVGVNLGSNAKLSATKDNYSVKFNKDKQVSYYGQMKAVFYNNGRIWIFDIAKGKSIAKGNYYNGGKKLVISDGKNKGKTIESGSVWTNLLNILR